MIYKANAWDLPVFDLVRSKLSTQAQEDNSLIVFLSVFVFSITNSLLCPISLENHSKTGQKTGPVGSTWNAEMDAYYSKLFFDSLYSIYLARTFTFIPDSC